MNAAADQVEALRPLRDWNQHIHAFVTLAQDDPEHAAGPLAGVSVGIKDIIDVAGLPTKCGSATRADTLCAREDAPVVAQLRGAGAHIVGKTTTTEFAFTDPTSCRNPHDLRRSPGGSSSGSGAAVAAGVVDIALGTQTAGSLCRPAAYCGVVGFKPTAGVLSQIGVVPLAPSFDTVGIIARDVALVQSAFAVMASATPDEPKPAEGQVICGFWQGDTVAQEDWAQALAEAGTALAELGFQTESCDVPADVAAVVSAHRIVMGAEAAVAHGDMLTDGRAALLKPKFLAGLRAGAEVTEGALADARAFLSEARQAFWAGMSQADFVLTLPVPEGAPLLDGTTGFQDWLTPWTVFGGPLVCLPWGVDTLSRPRSVMLAAHPGQDHQVLQMAAKLAARAPQLPVPELPL